MKLKDIIILIGAIITAIATIVAAYIMSSKDNKIYISIIADYIIKSTSGRADILGIIIIIAILAITIIVLAYINKIWIWYFVPCNDLIGNW